MLKNIECTKKKKKIKQKKKEKKMILPQKYLRKKEHINYN